MTKIIAEDVSTAADMLDAEFRDDYVGRGFDRKPCVGIVTSQSGVKVGLALAAALAERVAWDFDDEDLDMEGARDAVSGFSSILQDLMFQRMEVDSMGLDYIYYFPGVVKD